MLNTTEDFKPHHQYHLEFSGKGGEFFRIWIVNTLLTIITLGIYSAWAKVRTQRYFYGNTKLDDTSFQYLASPINILKGRLVAITLFISYYLLANFYPVYGLYFLIFGLSVVPLLFVLSQSFRMRNTAYRNIAFGFKGKVLDAYKIFALPFIVIIAINGVSVSLLPIQEKLEETQNQQLRNLESQTEEQQENTEPATDDLLPTNTLTEEENDYLQSAAISIALLSLSIMLMFPAWQFLISRFQLNHTLYGRTSFNFDSSMWRFYKMYLLLLLEIIAMSIVFALCMAGLVNVMTDDIEPSMLAQNAPFVAMAVIGYLFIYLYIFAAYSAKHLNLIISSIRINHIEINSSLTTGGFFWLYLTNTLLIAISLGLFIPWVKIRSARYRLEHLQLFMDQDLNQFSAQQQDDKSAVGEEVGDLFDMDIGL